MNIKDLIAQNMEKILNPTKVAIARNKDRVLRKEHLGLEEAEEFYEISAYTTKGVYLGAFKSNVKNNEAYFIDDLAYESIDFQIAYQNAGSDIERANVIKSNSMYYIGANTRAALKKIADFAETNGENLERGFILYICYDYPNCANRELQVQDVSDYALDPSARSARITPFGVSYLSSWKRKRFIENDGTREIRGYFIMLGHTHGKYSIIDSYGETVWKEYMNSDYRPNVLNKPTSYSRNGGLADYEDIVFSDYEGHPAIVATALGYTIYATATKNEGVGNPYELFNKGQVYDYSGKILNKFLSTK